MTFRIFSNADDIAQVLASGDLKVRAGVRSTLIHYGTLLVTRVQAKASGRPGPNTPTGDYRRSIHMQTSEGLLGLTPGGFVVAVGTNKPQGRRLEFGFVGRDSLGRVYNQPPYPHFGPALDEISGPLEQALGRLVELV